MDWPMRWALAAVVVSMAAFSGCLSDADFEPLVSGDQSRFRDSEATARWVTDSERWRAFWHELRGNESEPPPVDFEREFVIGVFLGERPSSGYGVEVRNVGYEERHFEYFEVGYVETTPGSGCGVLTVVTHPYQLITVPSDSVRYADIHVDVEDGGQEPIACD